MDGGGRRKAPAADEPALNEVPKALFTNGSRQHHRRQRASDSRSARKDPFTASVTLRGREGRLRPAIRPCKLSVFNGAQVDTRRCVVLFRRSPASGSGLVRRTAPREIANGSNGRIGAGPRASCAGAHLRVQQRKSGFPDHS
jgi:hypothetical protein